MRLKITTAILAALLLAAGCRRAGSSYPPERPVNTRPTAAFSTIPTRREETEPAAAPRRVLQVPYVSQEGYPTGCESAVALMLLRAAGVEMGMDEFIDRHLTCGEFRWEAGGFTAPHPADKFVGDPRSDAAYGCYAPVILRALEDCRIPGFVPAEETGAPLSELCRRYIDAGRPVAVWATVDMQPVRQGTVWRVENTGESFTWPAGEHCLLLVGYDEGEDLYFFLDPWQGNGLVSWPRAVTEERYRELGRQAVGLTPLA